jgi:endonuclease-3
MTATGQMEGLLKALFERYPNPKIALNFSTPLELLVATILSAQATDKKVNEVTERLFKKYRTVRDYADAEIGTLEHDIKEINFFRNKAKMISKCTRQILEQFDGKVPESIEKLTSLSGIGRKTANVILGSAFGVPAIAVDTHVIRVTNRLGLVKDKDPEKIEFALMDIVPRQDWTRFSLAIILHGRETCNARKPLCHQCNLIDFCHYYKSTRA